MTYAPLLISLPVADRVRAHAFYRDGLGLDAIGELADDGVPEPLMFVLNPMSRLMLVPTDGFGWVIGDHHAAPSRDERMCSRHRNGFRRRRQGDRRACTQGRSDRCHGANATAMGLRSRVRDPDGHIWTVTSAKLPG